MATTTPKQLPKDLEDAIESGEPLSDQQLRELITFEAALIGLEFDEAVRRAYDNTLPHDPIGSDLRLLISVLVS